MVTETSPDLIYNHFKKLDTCVLVCIWSILLFSVAILTGEYILYNYLKPKLLQKDIFLYFFSATILFYLAIVLAGFYILSKVDDYKRQQTSSSKSTESEVTRPKQDDFENASILKKSNAQNSRPLMLGPQQNRTIQQLYPGPSLSDRCSHSKSSTMEKNVGEMDRNIPFIRKLLKACEENCKNDKCCKSMQNLTEHDTRPFLQSCTDACHWIKVIRETESCRKDMTRTCAKNVPDAFEIKQKMQEPSTRFISKQQMANVDETSFALLPKKPATDDLGNDSCRKQTNKIVIPEIIIEDVDEHIATYLPTHYSGGMFNQLSAKNNLAAPEAAIKCIACFKCKTSRPIQMSCNTVGLPEPVTYINQIKSDKNMINYRDYSKNQIFDDTKNGNHNPGSQNGKSYYGEDAKRKTLEIEKRRLNRMNYVKFASKKQILI